MSAGDSPFVETDEQASLRRIAEVVRARKKAKADMARIKEQWTEAKAAYRKAMEEEQPVADAETTELPLFPRVKEKPAKKSFAAPGPAPAAPADGAPADAGPAAGGDDEAYRKTFLSELKGIPMAALVALGEKGIQTCGEVDDYLATGKALADIPGLDASAVKKILKEVARFKGGQADKGKPAA
jgi:hypothetical protein